MREVLVHPGWWAFAATCWLAACAMPLAVIDATTRRLPDWLTIPAWAGTLLLLAPAGWPAFERALLGGLALAGFYLALVLISPSGMGLGDVKAAGSLGSLLAWAGWRALFFGGFAGFALAALYSLVLLACGRVSRKQQIPFGPFMIVGAFAVLLALLVRGYQGPRSRTDAVRARPFGRVAHRPRSTGPGAHVPHPGRVPVRGVWPTGPALRGQGPTHPTQGARPFGACGPPAPLYGAWGPRTPPGARASDLAAADLRFGDWLAGDHAWFTGRPV